LAVEEAEMDKWASWLLHRRDGDDLEQRMMALEHLVPIRDRVLDGARLHPGDVLLDVGAGNGLIAFGALELVGLDGRVTASDVSSDLVDVTRSIALEAGTSDRMSFVVANAEDLEPIASQSVDVVTTRSVLIYVDDKEAAFCAFHRVLRPGGRASIFEPINNYFPDDPSEFWGFDATPVRDLVEKIWLAEGWDEESKRNDPMMNFSERDLVAMAEKAGFAEVHADLDIDVKPGSWVVDWDRLMGTSPNPNALSAGESIAAALSPAEAARFEQHLRPLVDGGRGVRRMAGAYLVATKS
jgi:ubiquinone/menaquinone biosynthesis C-methylase UbiE